MADIRPHLERNLAQAEQLGQTSRAKALQARINKLDKAAEKAEEKAELEAAPKKAAK